MSGTVRLRCPDCGFLRRVRKDGRFCEHFGWGRERCRSAGTTPWIADLAADLVAETLRHDVPKSVRDRATRVLAALQADAPNAVRRAAEAAR
jgi:hypothetical protein